MMSNKTVSKGLLNLNKLTELAKDVRGISAESKSVLRVSVDSLYSAAQVRKRFRDLESLGQTLLSEGQQQPIIVLPKDEKGYLIKKGERRWRAAKMVGLEYVDIIIDYRVQTNLQEVAGQLIENIQRDSLTPLEIAEALNIMKTSPDFSGLKDLARLMGKTTKWISTHLSLLSLPSEAKELHDLEIVTDVDTLNALRQIEKIDSGEYHKLIKKAKTPGGITRHIAREKLGKVKAPTEPLTGETEEIAAIHHAANPKGYKDVDPGEVQIQVSVILEDAVLNGILLLNRIDDETGFAWVKLEGAARPKRYPMDQIELRGVGLI